MLQSREILQEKCKQQHNFWLVDSPQPQQLLEMILEIQLAAWIWWWMEYNVQCLIWYINWELLLIGSEVTTYLLFQAAEVEGQKVHKMGPGWMS